MRGEVQCRPAGAADPSRGDREASVWESLGFLPASLVAVEGEELHPVGEVEVESTMAHQIWFWAYPCRSRLVRPLSLLVRIWFSQRARAGAATRARPAGCRTRWWQCWLRTR